MKFAKIFDIGTNQVLVMKTTGDDEDEPHLIKMVTDTDGVSVECVLGYLKKGERDTEFEEFNQSRAETFLLSALDFFH